MVNKLLLVLAAVAFILTAVGVASVGPLHLLGVGLFFLALGLAV